MADARARVEKKREKRTPMPSECHHIHVPTKIHLHRDPSEEAHILQQPNQRSLLNPTQKDEIIFASCRNRRILPFLLTLPSTALRILTLRLYFDLPLAPFHPKPRSFT
jgi:hypothetical protein